MNGAVGELGWHNPYAYANGNPANLVDPSGLCAQPTQWWNPVDANCYYSAVGLARRFSQGDPQAYTAWFDVLIQKNWAELKGIEGLGTVNDATILPSLALREDPRLVLQALQQFGCQAASSIGQGVALGVAAPNPSVAVTGGAIVLGIGAGVAILLLLNAASRAIADAVSHQRAASGVYEFRLTGLDAKVNDLAQHLAKLLEHDVAGHPPSGPNPYGDPNKGWCQTIRRIIEEIDNADYTERQFNRDLEQAHITSQMWNEIRDAVKEVIKKGLCNDHWGDFGGGSLAH